MWKVLFNECPKLVKDKEGENTPRKIEHKLSTIGSSIEWDDFDINDWQLFTHGVVEEECTVYYLFWINLKNQTVEEKSDISL